MVLWMDSSKISACATEAEATELHGAKDLRVVSRTINAPGNGEVQVAIISTGLCGSDLHYYNHYRNGDILVREPLTLGHESSGVVMALGDDVENLHIGDVVALEVGVPCGDCQRCKESRYNICKRMRFRSSAAAFPHAQGTLQERLNHPAKWCHLLKPGMSPAMGALTEPLCVAIHAINRANLEPNTTVLVIGAGAVGLLVAAMCKIKMAGKVVITDVDQPRVDFALSHRFADSGIVGSSKRAETVNQNLEISRDAAVMYTESLSGVDGDSGMFDVTFECTGVPSCLQASIYATRPGGKVMMVGMGSPVQTLPISSAALREVDLCGVFRYANVYATAIDVLSTEGQPDWPDFKSLISHTFTGLNAVEQAFAMASRKQDDMGNMVLKVIVNFPTPWDL